MSVGGAKRWASVMRWGTWGAILGLLLFLTFLPSWPPNGRVIKAVVVFLVPTLFMIGIGWLTTLFRSSR